MLWLMPLFEMHRCRRRSHLFRLSFYLRTVSFDFLGRGLKRKAAGLFNNLSRRLAVLLMSLRRSWSLRIANVFAVDLLRALIVLCPNLDGSGLFSFVSYRRAGEQV